MLDKDDQDNIRRLFLNWFQSKLVSIFRLILKNYLKNFEILIIISFELKIYWKWIKYLE